MPALPHPGPQDAITPSGFNASHTPPGSNTALRLLWGDLKRREQHIKAKQAKEQKHELMAARQRLKHDPEYKQYVQYLGSKYANGKYAHQVKADHPWRTPRINSPPTS